MIILVRIVIGIIALVVLSLSLAALFIFLGITIADWIMGGSKA